jgi:hypothetical protein
VMFTHRLDEQDDGKRFRERNNTTLSVDGFIRPDDTWTIQYLATASRDNSKDSIGFAGSFFAGRNLPKWYYGWVTKYVDEKYVPGMGFTFATNTIHHNPGGYFIWRPKKLKWIRRQDPGFFVNYYQNASNGKFQQADIYLFPIYLIFQDGSFLQYSITPTWQRIDFNFSILGLPIEMKEYFYTRQKIDYNTDQSRKYSFNGSYEFGPYYNGHLQTARLGVRVAPIPNVAMTAEYENNRLRGVGREGSQLTTHLVTGGLRLAYNPNVLASVFYQYNSFTHQGRWNVRASWQFAPLSFLHIVFNESLFKDSPVQNQSLIGKLSYLKQF